MDKQKTVWEAFMEFVNSKEIGTIITRQEIIQYINRENWHVSIRRYYQ
jgi:hypothetical protein